MNVITSLAKRCLNASFDPRHFLMVVTLIPIGYYGSQIDPSAIYTNMTDIDNSHE